MERVKVNLPAHFSFSTHIKIRITDINYGGHVGNDSFLSLIHEARLQYLAHYGYSEMDVEGVGLIMADVALEFKKELVYGDEVKISVQASGFDRLGFDIFYLLEIVAENTTTIAGKAKTGMMCFDYTQKKKASLSPIAIAKMQG